MPKGVYKRKSNTRVGKYERTEEIRKKLSEAAKGNTAHWKGMKAGYWARHAYISKLKGSPRKCELCKTRKAKRYEWANISGKYFRNCNDYIRLCKSCHYKYDKEKWGETTKMLNNGTFRDYNRNIPWVKKKLEGIIG